MAALKQNTNHRNKCHAKVQNFKFEVPPTTRIATLGYYTHRTRVYTGYLFDPYNLNPRKVHGRYGTVTMYNASDLHRVARAFVNRIRTLSDFGHQYLEATATLLIDAIEDRQNQSDHKEDDTLKPQRFHKYQDIVQWFEELTKDGVDNFSEISNYVFVIKGLLVIQDEEKEGKNILCGVNSMIWNLRECKGQQKMLGIRKEDCWVHPKVMELYDQSGSLPDVPAMVEKNIV